MGRWLDPSGTCRTTLHRLHCMRSRDWSASDAPAPIARRESERKIKCNKSAVHPLRVCLLLPYVFLTPLPLLLSFAFRHSLRPCTYVFLPPSSSASASACSYSYSFRVTSVLSICCCFSVREFVRVFSVRPTLSFSFPLFLLSSFSPFLSSTTNERKLNERAPNERIEELQFSIKFLLYLNLT